MTPMYAPTITDTIQLLHARREEIDSTVRGIEGGREAPATITRVLNLDERIRETLEELYYAKASVEAAIEKLGRFASMRR